MDWLLVRAEYPIVTHTSAALFAMAQGHYASIRGFLGDPGSALRSRPNLLRPGVRAPGSFPIQGSSGTEQFDLLRSSTSIGSLAICSAPLAKRRAIDIVSTEL